MKDNHLELSDFAPFLNHTFTLKLAGGNDQLEVRLLEADAVESPTLPPGHRSPFRVLFHAFDYEYVPQGTYLTELGELGEQGVFLVPVGPKDGGMLMEAVFN